MKMTSLPYTLNKMPEHLKNLPVNSISKDFISHMQTNRTAFISAPVATGKTTLLPLMLLLGKHYESWKNGNINLSEIIESRNVHVMCAVPTQTAAASAAAYVASILNVKVGTLVGYSTGMQKKFSKDTRILFATTGVMWLRELFQSIPDGEIYMILDECQAYTAPLEASLAWGKRILLSNPNFRLILMSATDKRAAKFIGAKVFSIQTKSYPVETRVISPDDIVQTIYKYAKEGKNVLCFVPGKSEIYSLCNKFQELFKSEIESTGMHVIPLHGTLSVEEQSQAFIKAHKIIFSTNVAQTSITPDVDVIVDTGLERRIVVREGQFVLDIVTISESDHLQRKGRAGRTKPGIYVWANDTPIEELTKYPIPAIYVNGLESILLQIISTGLNLSEVEFFHTPTPENYERVLKTLHIIGAIDSKNQITPIGQQMAKLPLSIRSARMVVEAIKRGVVKDIAKIVSIIEIGELKPPKVTYSDLGIFAKSDPICELQLYNKLFLEEQFPINIGSENLKILKNNFRKAYEIHSLLIDSLDKMDIPVTSTGDTLSIIKSYATGLLDNLAVKDSSFSNRNWYKSTSDGVLRKINLTSVAYPTKLVMGISRSVTYISSISKKQKILRLIVGAINVDQNFLEELAPELFGEEERITFSPETNSYECVVATLFNGVAISEKPISRTITLTEKKRAFASYLSSLVETLDTTSKGDLKVLKKIQSTYPTVEKREAYINEVINNKLHNKLPNPRKSDWLAKF